MPLADQWAAEDEPDLEDEFSLGLRFIGFYRMEGTQTDNLIKLQQKRNDFITIEILFLVLSISDILFDDLIGQLIRKEKTFLIHNHLFAYRYNMNFRLLQLFESLAFPLFQAAKMTSQQLKMLFLKRNESFFSKTYQ